MFNQKSVKWSFLIASVLILAACGEVGQSPSLSSSNSSSSSIYENGTDGLLFTRTIYEGKQSYVVSGYEGTSKDVIIPATFNNVDVVAIGSLAFAYVSIQKLHGQLENVVFPENLKFIGAGAFYNNKLTSVTISNSVTTIGEDAFDSNQLTSVIIPNSVTTIGASAFSNNVDQPFTIYVEAVSKPEGWYEYWYSGDGTVIWDYKNQN
jgi:hypothetical protein